MRLPSPHRQLKKGLKHPNRFVAASSWLLLLVLLLVLIRLAIVLIGDFWVILIAWMQP